MLSLSQLWSPPLTPADSQDDDVSSQPSCCDPLAYLATESLCHAVDFISPTCLDPSSTTTAHAPEDSNAIDDHRAHVSSVMSSSVISQRAQPADGNDPGRDLKTAHPQLHTPSIGNNNGQETPSTTKEFLSMVSKREPGLYLFNLNIPIDLTAIYSSRLNTPYPDEAVRSSQEPQTHSLAIRSR